MFANASGFSRQQHVSLKRISKVTKHSKPRPRAFFSRVSPRAHLSRGFRIHVVLAITVLYSQMFYTTPRAPNKRSRSSQSAHNVRSLVRSSRVRLVTCTLIYVMQAKGLTSRVRRASSRATAARARGPGGGGGEAGEARGAPHALRSQEQPQDQPQYSSATTTRKAANCRK